MHCDVFGDVGNVVCQVVVMVVGYAYPSSAVVQTRRYRL
jgi:hypothetical protein